MFAIKTQNLSKSYHIYRKPADRLKQMLFLGRKKFYDEYWALQNVSLEVKKGETIGLIGRNGSGKSTFLQLVCGTLTPTLGELTVNGRIAALLELGAGFNPEFTGRENVFLAASILGLTDIQIKEKYSSIENFAGIGDFINQPVKTYSSGMYARLAFAVAAHVEADILIVDEILAVGDVAFTQKCMGFINQFKKNGTIFFVSHDVNSILNLCDRVIWLDSGEVRESGIPKEVCFNYLASLNAEKDESNNFKIGGKRKQVSEAKKVQDIRHEKLKESDKRNVFEVFSFDPDAPWFGLRGISIEDVKLLDEDDNINNVLTGGEVITLRVKAKAHQTISQPIIGFFIRDKLGQNLFGDNTYLSFQNQTISLQADDEFFASFKFQMPYLPAGDFSITVAVANGTQENHVQHHWIEDALFFHVLNSHAAKGLIGVPMIKIELEKAA